VDAASGKYSATIRQISGGMSKIQTADLAIAFSPKTMVNKGGVFTPVALVWTIHYIRRITQPSFMHGPFYQIFLYSTM
jgi:hypothetical protein